MLCSRATRSQPKPIAAQTLGTSIGEHYAIERETQTLDGDDRIAAAPRRKAVPEFAIVSRTVVVYTSVLASCAQIR